MRHELRVCGSYRYSLSSCKQVHPVQKVGKSYLRALDKSLTHQESISGDLHWKKAPLLYIDLIIKTTVKMTKFITVLMQQVFTFLFDTKFHTIVSTWIIVFLPGVFLCNWELWQAGIQIIPSETRKPLMVQRITVVFQIWYFQITAVQNISPYFNISSPKHSALGWSQGRATQREAESFLLEPQAGHTSLLMCF